MPGGPTWSGANATSATTASPSRPRPFLPEAETAEEADRAVVVGERPGDDVVELHLVEREREKLRHGLASDAAPAAFRFEDDADFRGSAHLLDVAEPRLPDERAVDLDAKEHVTLVERVLDRVEHRAAVHALVAREREVADLRIAPPRGDLVGVGGFEDAQPHGGFLHGGRERAPHA